MGVKYAIIVGILGFIIFVAGKKLWSEDVDLTDVMEDSYLTTPQLIKKYGYTSETHSVVTTDGYILGIHRIRHKDDDSIGSDAPRKVFLLWHGLESSSSDWVFIGPHQGLAYYLSDLGYDVWLGNSRGNRYSKNHISLSPTNSSFWRFSFHEIGTIDLPNTIDYIINKTGVQNVTYGGFSQGTAQLFVLASENPEFMTKINHAHCISPVVFLNHTISPIFSFLTTFIAHLEAKQIFTEPYAVLSDWTSIQLLGRFFCTQRPFQRICTEVIYLIAGMNSPQLNETMLPVILSHFPAGASSQQFAHFGQLIMSGKFLKYDYGVQLNKQKYGQESPPEYLLSNMNIPIVLYYSDNDSILQPVDALRLVPLLPNLIEAYRVPDELFNHFDFVGGIDARTLLYRKIAQVAEKYS